MSRSERRTAPVAHDADVSTTVHGDDVIIVRSADPTPPDPTPADTPDTTDTARTTDTGDTDAEAAGRDTAAPAPDPAPPDAPAPRRHDPRYTVVRALCILLAVLTAAEMLVSPIAPYFPAGIVDQPGEVARKRQQLDLLAGQPLDVLFMGDSIMDSAGDPTVFADRSRHFATAYNGALLGAPFSGQISWLGRVVLPRVKPRLIVELVSPFAIAAPDADGAAGKVLDDNIETAIDRSEPSWWRDLDRSASDVSYLVRHRHALRQPTVVWTATRSMMAGDEPTAGRRNPIRDKLAAPGYWDQHVSSGGRYTDFNSLFLPPRFDTNVIAPALAAEPNYGAFQRLLDYERESGAQVVVVIAPIAIGAYTASGVDLDRWRAIARGIEAHARELGASTIDLTDAGFMRPEFNDYLHLNDRGSLRFSAEIARRIDALCDEGTLACP